MLNHTVSTNPTNTDKPKQSIIPRIDTDKVDLVCQRLKVLSNPDRLKILCILVGQEHCVQDIEDITQIYQPSLSQQLTVLRRANMVATRRVGKQIFYHIADQKVLTMMQTLYALYCTGESDSAIHP